MSEMGKMYYGLVPLEFGTPTGGGEPADPSVPICPDVDGSYTIPGTLIGDFTASGTFTPPAGVTLVHVCVIGGGGAGGSARIYNGNQSACGGAGGEVTVFRNVPVSAPVAVSVGGSDTGSSFGGMSARAGRTPIKDQYGYMFPPHGWTDGGYPSAAGHWMPYGEWNRQGRNGVMVNGAWYCGGGAGGYTSGGSDLNNYGGAGGGGKGAWNATFPTAGANGLGGGGGGGVSYSNSGEDVGALGGSGRVMVFTEQTTREAFAAPVEPVIMAALNDGVMVGAYAIDPVAPVDTLGVLVPYPLEPQPTGEVWTDEETGETHPVLAWPEKGWTYSNGDWSP